MLKSFRTRQFKTEFALAEKRGRNMNKLIEIMRLLINEQPLPPERRDHPLHGDWERCRECHIQGDWLLVYEIDPKDRSVTFVRTGAHSDLF